MKINIILFNDFETLDIFGPVEVLGQIPEYEITYYSKQGGMIHSAQNACVMTEPMRKITKDGIVVIPGGMGTRALIEDAEFLDQISQCVSRSAYCLSICTGSAVLAKSGVLNHRKATSNKQALEWVKANGPEVLWQDKARWCVDGNFYTASGVSAGIDMTLGFIADQFGKAAADQIAKNIEYVWNDDCTNDPFCKM